MANLCSVKENRERGLPAWTWFRGMFSPHLLKCPLDERAFSFSLPFVRMSARKCVFRTGSHTTNGSLRTSTSGDGVANGVCIGQMRMLRCQARRLGFERFTQ